MPKPKQERRQLCDSEIKRLASALASQLVQQVKAQRHEFWIDPEKHYKAHINLEKFGEVFTDETIAALRELTQAFDHGRSIFWKIFISLVVLGSIGIALFAFTKKGGG